ncbi:hypothetical protein WJ0W_005480 [Paenibacillus melissococcoides]|uniref:Uncharacterized protein n=2 Tax=Paenibacillus melissococcoides TaxID=2912268 RepID=A0ABM9G967_9BACL|nr:hypothetical protein [Paenibacillus melissococcoides]CAH8248222.1 hypothetical protein WJ0W_005480 [Paenibacillus melissococcoides]
MENEVEIRIHDPFQGYGDSLLLISYLLAKFRRPETCGFLRKPNARILIRIAGILLKLFFLPELKGLANTLKGFSLPNPIHICSSIKAGWIHFFEKKI